MLWPRGEVFDHATVHTAVRWSVRDVMEFLKGLKKSIPGTAVLRTRFLDYCADPGEHTPHLTQAEALAYWTVFSNINRAVFPSSAGSSGSSASLKTSASLGDANDWCDIRVLGVLLFLQTGVIQKRDSSRGILGPGPFRTVVFGEVRIPYWDKHIMGGRSSRMCFLSASTAAHSPRSQSQTLHEAVFALSGASSLRSRISSSPSIAFEKLQASPLVKGLIESNLVWNEPESPEDDGMEYADGSRPSSISTNRSTTASDGSGLDIQYTGRALRGEDIMRFANRLVDNRVYTDSEKKQK
ncbi:hypothetical protein FOZ60_001063 [Perkinsus olseni]|uniref:Uncharacterized protein n=1 Tax=Perkinsus olseni TaxID=32597 RepID=A0A7J6P261_PEROL|nr:hypothetical protein FOZ60_001063 [Perkinsus olseni]